MKNILLIVTLLASTHFIQAQKKTVSCGDKTFVVWGKIGQTDRIGTDYRIDHYYHVTKDSLVFYKVNYNKGKMNTLTINSFALAPLKGQKYSLNLKHIGGQKYIIQTYVGGNVKHGKEEVISGCNSEVRSQVKYKRSIEGYYSSKTEAQTFMDKIKQKIAAIK